MPSHQEYCNYQLTFIRKILFKVFQRVKLIFYHNFNELITRTKSCSWSVRICDKLNKKFSACRSNLSIKRFVHETIAKTLIWITFSHSIKHHTSKSSSSLQITEMTGERVVGPSKIRIKSVLFRQLMKMKSIFYCTRKFHRKHLSYSIALHNFNFLTHTFQVVTKQTQKLFSPFLQGYNWNQEKKSSSVFFH